MQGPIAPRNDRIFLVSQFLYATIFTIPIWIAYYTTKISLVEVSMLVAIQYAAQLFMELPTGAFADLIGRRASVVIGYVLWAIATVLMLLAPGFWLLAAATVLAGLAESFLSGSLEAIVYDAHKQNGTEDRFPHIMAQNNILFQFGLILGTISGGFLYHVWYALPYILYAALCLLAALASFFMIEPKIDSERFTPGSYLKQIREGTAHAFHNRKTTLVSLYYVAVAGVTWTVNLYFFDLALTQMIASDQIRGIAGAAVRLVNIILIKNLISREDVFTRRVSVWFFPVAMVIGYFGSWVFFDSVWIALLFLSVAVMAGTARWVILTRYTNECFRSKYRATAISALSMLVGLIFTIITSVSGYLMNVFDGVSSMFLLLGIATLLVILPLARQNVRVYRIEGHR